MTTTDADLAFAGIAEQAALLRSRDISSRELTQLYLDRIERHDPALNAFRVVLADEALAAADDTDRRLARGETAPLLGVPIAVKDGWDVAGQITTHGTGAIDEPVAADCEFVARLRAAGAVVLGKTNQPELAIWMHTESATWGATRNPWSLDYVPGGSSGGSGAAVAAGLVGAASASDGGGSIRLPASACGLFGLKPQRGRVPLTPYDDHWHGLSSAGCLTRSVRDTALWLDVVAGGQLLAATARPRRPLRIAVTLSSTTGEVPAPDIVAAVQTVADALRSLGHAVDAGLEIDADLGAKVLANFHTRYLRGIADDHRRLPHPERAMPLTRDVADYGASISDDMVREARAAEDALAKALNSPFERYDLLLTPAVAQQPFRVGERDDKDALWWAEAGNLGFTGAPYMAPWNVTGQPAASIPAGFDAAGLPLGVQLVARPDDEQTLISAAAQVETALDWTSRRPELS